MKNQYIFLMIFVLVTASFEASACDLCSIYNGLAFQKPTTGSYRLGVSEQFSEFATLKDDGNKIDNSMHQRMLSSVTQVVAGYDVSQKLSLQLNLPYYNRRFARFENGALERGTEAGFGDMSLLARYAPYQYNSGDEFLNVQFIGGIKLPTGDSSRLKEELSENEPMMITRHGGEHHDIPSAVHGHDLALGSGSFDYPLGISMLAEKGRTFLKGGAMYTIRTAGDYQYQYADDFSWDFGPGYFIDLEHERSIAARIILTGENKSNDSGADKVLASDTGLKTIFWGPELTATVDDSIMADMSYELPVSIDNTGVQAVTSYRLKAGITVRF